MLVLPLMAWMGLDFFADATQDRPDAHLAGSTALTVNIRHRDPAVKIDPVEATKTHWSFCSRTLPAKHDLVAVVPLDTGRVQLVIEPVIGEHALRRFEGCMGDVNFDRLLTDVTAVRTIPAG